MSIHASLPEAPHRRMTLQALLVATIVGAILFGALNLSRGLIALAIIEFAMGTFALALMVIVRDTHRLHRWTLLYLVPFFSAMLFALATPAATATVFVWILLIPIISHLLLGRWLGLAVATVFLLAAGAIYLYRFHADPALVNTIAVANIAMCSLVILGLSNAAEYVRERYEHQLLQQASTDALTGLANRTHLKTVFQRERNRATREGTALSLLLLDLDHFKDVNDAYGHETGDAALAHVATLIRARLRITDLPCRFGGEEFAILMSGTNGTDAAALAELLRETLASTPLRQSGNTIALTASIGVAELGPDGNDLDVMLARADERLFTAKRQGRNRVVTDTCATEAPEGALNASPQSAC